MESETEEFEARWREAVEKQALRRNFAYPWNVVEIEELSKCGVWTEESELHSCRDLNLSGMQDEGNLDTLDSYLRSELPAPSKLLDPPFYTPLKPTPLSLAHSKENLPFKSHLTPKSRRPDPPLQASPNFHPTATFHNPPKPVSRANESVPLVNFDQLPEVSQDLESEIRSRKDGYETDVQQLYAGLDQFLSGVKQIREDLKTIEKESQQKLSRIGSRS